VAGYSGTTLVKKLGVKAGYRLALVNAPTGFVEELGPLPEGAVVARRGQQQQQLNLILFFAANMKELDKEFACLKARLVSDGMLWVAWPKKSSGVATDLSFEGVQRFGLASGMVDTKVCAIDEVWSGLRFVIRLKDR